MSVARAVRLRLILLGTALTLGGGALALIAVADFAIDTRLNDELAFVYNTHLKTVRDLVDFAKSRAIEPTAELAGQLARAEAPPDPRDHAGFRSFERRHDVLAGATRELITTLDGAVDPDDARLGKLVRRFDSEERSLGHIRDRFRAATLLTRLGDLVP